MLISGMIHNLVRNQVSGWIRYPVQSNIIRYSVKSYIRYYPVHNQLLATLATTDLHGIKYVLFIQWPMWKGMAD